LGNIFTDFVKKNLDKIKIYAIMSIELIDIEGKE